MIDSHFHIWQLARGDYGWLTLELRPIYRDVAPEHWREQATACNVTRGILVQAAPTEAETAFLLQQAAQHSDFILGVVGWVDMEAPDAPARIAKLATNLQLTGLRPMLHDLPDPAWILGAKLAPALAAMAHNAITFDALVRPVHLRHILELARRHPSLRIVVDHGAKPDIAADVFAPWADLMTRIARETSAFCKLSGLLTEAGPKPDPKHVQRYVDHLLDCFGPKRLLWGSDWPVLELVDSYKAWHTMAMQMVPQPFHDDVFERTALKAYPRRYT